MSYQRRSGLPVQVSGTEYTNLLSKIDFGRAKTFLLRVIVVDDIDPAVVITVYSNPI
jgi:hypothetical protein